MPSKTIKKLNTIQEEYNPLHDLIEIYDKKFLLDIEDFNLKLCSLIGLVTNEMMLKKGCDKLQEDFNPITIPVKNRDGQSLYSFTFTEFVRGLINIRKNIKEVARISNSADSNYRPSLQELCDEFKSLVKEADKENNVDFLKKSLDPKKYVNPSQSLSVNGSSYCRT